MPTSEEALTIALLVVMPGVLASRTWQAVARIRAESIQEYRLGSILIWAGITGMAALLNGAYVRGALDSAMRGTIGLEGFLWLLTHFGLGPWLAALGAGYLARLRCVRRAMECIGAIHPRASTPWDDVFGAGEVLRVTFSHAGREYSGTFERADTEGTQLVINDLYVEVDGRWTPITQSTAALLLNGGERVLWLERPSETHRRESNAECTAESDPQSPTRAVEELAEPDVPVDSMAMSNEPPDARATSLASPARGEAPDHHEPAQTSG